MIQRLRLFVLFVACLGCVACSKDQGPSPLLRDHETKRFFEQAASEQHPPFVGGTTVWGGDSNALPAGRHDTIIVPGGGKLRSELIEAHRARIREILANGGCDVRGERREGPP